MCSFCSEFLDGSMRIIDNDESWVFLPTIGCFNLGYCLFMPIDHVRSFASIAREELREAHEKVEYYRATIAAEFQSHVIIAEHGPGLQCMGAACCDHAHLHLIPINQPDDVLAAYTDVGGVGERLEAFEEIDANSSRDYLYLSPAAGEHFVWTSRVFPKQFVRRVCARLSGLGELWNWRNYPYLDKRDETLSRLRQYFMRSMNGASEVNLRIVG